MVKKFVYIISSLELFSFGLILPMLGMQIAAVGGNRFILGMLGSAMALLQFVSGPLIGSWSDNVGAKPALLVSAYGLFLGKFVFAFPTLYCYIIGRIIQSCFLHGQILIRTLLAESKETDQAEVESKLRAYGALSFTVAPIIGGYIMSMEQGFFKLSILLIALEVVNIVVCHCLPTNGEKTKTTKQTDVSQRTKTNADKSKDAKPSQKLPVKASPFKQVIDNLKAVNWRIFGTLFFLRFLVETAVSIYSQNMGYVFAEVFKCTPTQVGLIISFYGVCAIIINMNMKRLKRYVTDGYKCGTLGMLIAFITVYLLPYFWVYISVLIVFSVFKPILEDTWTHSLIEMADNKNKGAVTGAFQSLVQLSGFIAPLVNGYVGEVYGYSSTILLTCAICLAAVGSSFRLSTPKTKAE